MNQTQMYICTLVEFILVDLDTLPHKAEVIYIGNYTGIYTIATIDVRKVIDLLISMFALHLTPCIVNWYHQ